MITYQDIDIPNTTDEWELYHMNGVQETVLDLTEACMKAIDMIKTNPNHPTIEIKAINVIGEVAHKNRKFGASDTEPLKAACYIIANAMKKFSDREIDVLELYFSI